MDWVFQCNPKRYDLASELDKGIGTDSWAMNQHRERVSPGDRVFFWQTGPNACLLAIGHVDSPVYEREDPPFGRHGVDVILDYRIAPPITRPEVLDQKALSSFGPFKGAMGTNFPIPDNEITVALDSIVEGRRVPFPAAGGLTSSIDDAQLSLDKAIKRAKSRIAVRLKEYISAMDPIGFEWLIRALLLNLGYKDVIVTKPSGDGGVDVKATLVEGGIAKIRTCIQVKRQQSVGAPVVQNIRGALNAHEAGVLITSGQFTPAAVSEADDPHKVPITLVNGNRLAELLLQHKLGVEPVSLTYYTLKLDELSKERLEAIVEERDASDT